MEQSQDYKVEKNKNLHVSIINK